MVDAALLHCLDHVAATAQRIKKNNDALKAQPDLDVPQDQGFTRPKVFTAATSPVRLGLEIDAFFPKSGQM